MGYWGRAAVSGFRAMILKPQPRWNHVLDRLSNIHDELWHCRPAVTMVIADYDIPLAVNDMNSAALFIMSPL